MPTVPVPQAAPATVEAPHERHSAEMLLALVSERTGYPVAMLDVSLDLEADLGIDSIIIVGPGELRVGGTQRSTVLADTVEAASEIAVM